MPLPSNENAQESLHSQSISSSNTVSNEDGTASLPAPDYSITSNGMEDENSALSNGKIDDSVLASKLQEFKNAGNQRFDGPEISTVSNEFHIMRFETSSHYYYVSKQDKNTPLLISESSEGNFSEKFYVSSREFGDMLWRRITEKEMDRDKKDNSYMYLEDVKVSNSLKLAGGFLGFGTDWEETTVNVKELKYNITTGDTSFSLPGPISTTINLNLREKYFGFDPNKPNFGIDPKFTISLPLGPLATITFNPETAQVTFSVGISAAGIGANISATYKINTDKTSQVSEDFLIRELFPEIGQLVDALG